MRFGVNQLGSLSVFLIVVTALGGAADSAGADRLAARLYDDSLLLYEPIVVHVELHLDKAFIPPEVLDDPYEANRQLGRLRRWLTLELRELGGEKVSGGILVIEFPRPSEPAQVLAATGLALLGRADPKTDEFHHWTRPGTFKLVVLDNENALESNEMSITFKIPSGMEFNAARIFTECGVDAIAALVGERPRRSESTELLRSLAAEYPETVYGKYAVVAVALLRWKDTFAQHNSKGGAEVWGPVAAELKRAAATFEGAHPLRGQALFDLARAQVWAGQMSEVRRTVETLATDFPTGELGRKARQLRSELDEFEGRGTQKEDAVDQDKSE